jgi:hypothetical protein
MVQAGPSWLPANAAREGGYKVRIFPGGTIVRMNRPWWLQASAVTVGFWASTCVAAEGATVDGEAASRLPASAQALVDGYQAASARIAGKAQQEIAKEREHLLAVLQQEKDAETGRGNLAAALAIKAKIEALTSGRDQASLNVQLAGEDVREALAAPNNAIPLERAQAIAGALDHLTEADWDRLGGLGFVVDSHSVTGAVETGVALKEGERLLVVPNPNDKWRCGANPNDNAPMTFLGDVVKDPRGTIRWGCLYLQLGDKVMPPGFAIGVGRLWLKCNDGTTVDNSGVIRVKVLKVVP